MEYAENREYEMKQMAQLRVATYSVDKRSSKSEGEGREAGRSVPCHQAVAVERRETSLFSIRDFSLIPLHTHHTMFDLPNAKRYVSKQSTLVFFDIISG